MSRRKRGPETDLGQEFVKRGLMRYGWAASRLGVDRDRFRELVQAGHVPSVEFLHDGHPWRGVVESEVEKLAKKMGVGPTILPREWVGPEPDMSHGGAGDPGADRHLHRVPGVWDDDNREMAGKVCAQCWRRNRPISRVHAAGEVSGRG